MTSDTIAIQTAAKFVVVSFWQDKSSDGRKGSHEYEAFPTLNDALDIYDEYDRGEFERARPVGIFAADESGLPIGTLSPLTLIRQLNERRAA